MKTKLNQLPAIKTTYKSILKELINDKVIYVSNNDYFKLGDKCLLISHGDDPLNWKISCEPLEYVLKNANGAIYEEVEVKWYDNIPNQGILCKVWDDEKSIDKYDMTIIYEYDESRTIFIAGNTSYFHARPLTLDEMKDHLYED